MVFSTYIEFALKGCVIIFTGCVQKVYLPFYLSWNFRIATTKVQFHYQAYRNFPSSLISIFSGYIFFKGYVHDFWCLTCTEIQVTHVPFLRDSICNDTDTTVEENSQLFQSLNQWHTVFQYFFKKIEFFCSIKKQTIRKSL